MDRLEVLDRVKKELKIYKEYLLNLKVIDSINSKDEEEKPKEKEEITVKKKVMK